MQTKRHRAQAQHYIGTFLAAAILFAATSMVWLATPGIAMAKSQVMTAASIFSQLPPTIFDNTFLPVSEEDKNKLLATGTTSDWTIAHNSPDYMYLMPMHDDFANVEVHVFRGAEGGVAVLGARTSDNCAVEIWGFDARGGLIPYSNPEEPVVSDYLPQNSKLEPGVTPTYRLCLEGEKLEAKAMFWNDSGLASVPTVNRVFYSWNGSAFIKEVTPDTSQHTDIQRDTPVPAGPGNATKMQQ